MLCGGWLRFAAVLEHRRGISTELLPDLAPDRLTRARAPWAGLSLDRPRVMGIVNVTPDSFSDGGEHATAEAAVRHGMALAEAGADVVDVGGESTRPGATPTPIEEEMRRVLPVVRALARAGLTVSIDSRNAATMAAALEAGAAIVNDVSALRHDPASLALVASAGCPVVLMHIGGSGDPRTMQASPTYDEVLLDVFEALDARVRSCVAAGIPRERILVDPGIGFGKRLEHNLALLGHVGLFHSIGCGLLVGASRKGFAGTLTREPDPRRRLPASLAAALAAIERGVQMVRVHDVAETAQALTVFRAIRS